MPPIRLVLIDGTAYIFDADGWLWIHIILSLAEFRGSLK